ncbi:LytTR family transcriptional regulator [candidate division KSB1 bacterium]|nr:MAG: LytTR family transcriptional regulator [candidate division KSB1 bacterium]
MLLDILNQPYPFNNNFKHNIKSIGLVSMGFVLIVLYIQPFGINFLQSENDGYFVFGTGVITAGVLFLNTAILPSLLPRLFAPRRWTIRKEIIWNSWMFFNLFSLFVLMAWVARQMNFTILPLLRTGSLALLPLLLFNIISYNRALLNRLTNAIDSGKNIFKEEAREAVPHKAQKEEIVTEKAEEPFSILAENGNDRFEKKSAQVLCIRSSGNYIEIFWLDERKSIRKILFRQSLINTERALGEGSQFKRCHRCWIVNTDKITAITGNAKGYQLELEACDFKVPVSKNYSNQFNKKEI